MPFVFEFASAVVIFFIEATPQDFYDLRCGTYSDTHAMQNSFGISLEHLIYCPGVAM